MKTAQNIKDAKEYWAASYATGGYRVKSIAFRQYKPELYWKSGEYEMLGCLDATDCIPSGSSGWLTHVVSR